ncbi:ABC transporter substrate-binding protein [Halobacteriovorax sp. DA5]|uniref:substrate-binding periplasmic protein n=1 Tax=Halobacteriovorax sp. DA5 TaxID=2067553 RepID=UPI001304E45F|nr:transporter substrate-binding domain-containing protein [Halobacteriovorax sp. DA5]
MNYFTKYALIFAFSTSLFAAKEVQVGAYQFPPFYISKNGKKSGLVYEVIKELNKVQSEYRFKIVETSARRRYRDFTTKRFDLILFESPKWGWEERGIKYDMTPSFLKGGEKFIAKKDKNRTHAYLRDLKKKSILLYDGYHYGFLDFDIDQKYDAKLIYTNSHEGNILSVLKGRGDIAVVTESYLTQFLEDNKNLKDKLIISTHYDQEYSHRALVTQDSIITSEKFYHFLKLIKDRPCCRQFSNL